MNVEGKTSLSRKSCRRTADDNFILTAYPIVDRNGAREHGDIVSKRNQWNQIPLLWRLYSVIVRVHWHWRNQETYTNDERCGKITTFLHLQILLFDLAAHGQMNWCCNSEYTEPFVEKRAPVCVCDIRRLQFHVFQQQFHFQRIGQYLNALTLWYEKKGRFYGKL